jgi:hypothetical protein
MLDGIWPGTDNKLLLCWFISCHFGEAYASYFAFLRWRDIHLAEFPTPVVRVHYWPRANARESGDSWQSANNRDKMVDAALHLVQGTYYSPSIIHAQYLPEFGDYTGKMGASIGNTRTCALPKPRQKNYTLENDLLDTQEQMAAPLAQNLLLQEQLSRARLGGAVLGMHHGDGMDNDAPATIHKGGCEDGAGSLGSESNQGYVGVISVPDAHIEECAPAMHIRGGGGNGSNTEDRGDEASHFTVTQYTDDTAFSANQSSGSLLLSTLSSSTITTDELADQPFATVRRWTRKP